MISTTRCWDDGGGRVKSLVERRKICSGLAVRYYPLGMRRDRVMEAVLDERLPEGGVFLDAGAGPELRLAAIFAGKARLSMGIDVVPMAASVALEGKPGALAVTGDLAALPVRRES